MFRITTIFLCVLFLAAVAGRYSAEESVRAAKDELRRLNDEYEQEARQLQMLRAEIAYLESPERLAKVAGATTDLRPPEPGAILSGGEFRSAMLGKEAPAGEGPAYLNESVIANALAMAQLVDVE